jgi:hypothetical protein
MAQVVKDIIPEVELNKYARWAADLDMGQLEALLTLVGEHFLRSPNPWAIRQHNGVYEGDPDAAVTPGDRRKVKAYNALIQFNRAPSGWSIQKVREAIVAALNHEEDPTTPKVKILSLTAGTYHDRDNRDNGCVELTLEVDGRTCVLGDANLPPSVAQDIRQWLADRLGFENR